MDRILALQAFVRLAELGTFSAASADLRVRQSTVSKWIAALEEELGVQLVERTTRSLRVTDAGTAFLKDAREVIAAYDAAAARVQRRSPALRGRLRINVPVVFGRLFVMSPVRGFARRHGDIEIEMVFSDRYVNLVEENVDVAVRVGTPVDSSFRTHRLGSTGRHAVASPGYLERFGVPTIPRDLEGHACLLHTELSRGDTWKFRQGSREHRVAVKGRFSANNSEALLAMAKAGQGVAMLAHWLVDRDLASGKLVRVLPDCELPPAPIAALTAPSRHPPLRVTAFIEHLRESLAPMFG